MLTSINATHWDLGSSTSQKNLNFPLQVSGCKASNCGRIINSDYVRSLILESAEGNLRTNSASGQKSPFYHAMPFYTPILFMKMKIPARVLSILFIKI